MTKVPRVHKDHRAKPVQRETLVRLVPLDKTAQPVRRVRKEQRALLVHKVNRVSKGKLVQLVRLDQLALQVVLASREPLVQWVQSD